MERENRMTRTGMSGEIEASEWAGAMGDKWLANLDGFEGMIASIGAALMAKADFAPGERVVDIGCGGGATTVEIGKAVGPQGEALGIDVSDSLLATARQRAAGAGNVRFLTGDAATITLDGAPRDRLFSRFGIMFFNDFAAAFANLRKMLRPGGRADFSAWAPASENGWIVDMQAILGNHVELPVPAPNAPGPFALKDADFARPLLEGAGFSSVEFDLWRGEQLVGGSGAGPEQAADFVLHAMSFGEALKDKPAALDQVRGELVALFAAHYRDGAVRMPAGAWLISARG
jgi:SAM-dependent methyltransferase